MRDKQVGDIKAFTVAGKVERIVEFLLRPTTGAEEFFDDAVETGTNCFFEQGEFLPRAFLDTNGFPRSEPILNGEELAAVYEIKELFKVVRNGSVADSHLPRIALLREDFPCAKFRQFVSECHYSMRFLIGG